MRLITINRLTALVLMFGSALLLPLKVVLIEIVGTSLASSVVVFLGLQSQM